MLLNILTLPDKKLRRVAEFLDLKKLKDPQIQTFIDNLIYTMKKKDGIGLAATQVDKTWRIFCVSTVDGPMIFVNPKILKYSWRKETQEEGCLSVPRIFGLVKRATHIKISAYNRHGKPFSLNASGLLARVIQHENDHLDGVLFIDKVKKITQGEKELKQLLKHEQ